MTPKNKLQVIPEAGWLRRYVDLYTPMSEAPAEAHYAAGLALLSACVGWRGHIRWNRSPEPLTVWVILEGQSAAARKTTSSGTAMSLARKVASAYTSGQPVDPDDPIEPPIRARRVSHTSDRGLIELVAPRDNQQRDQWENQYPPGTIIEWDEFGAVLGRPGDTKGSDWLGRVQARLMEMYGGRHGGIQTGATKLPEGRCAVSLIGTMTRRELEDRVSSGLLETGFMGRFVLIPFSGRTQILSRPPKWTADHEDRERELAFFLTRLLATKTEFGQAFDRLTTKAGEQWDDWYRDRSERLEQRADKSGDREDAALYSAFNRLQTTAMKVAATLAISEWEPGTSLEQVEIHPRHITSGTSLAEYALHEVHSLLTVDHANPTSEYQRKVKQYVERLNGDGPTTMRTLFKSIRTPLKVEERRRAIWALHPEELYVETIHENQHNESTLVGPPKGD